jgi:hypothetical protein
VCSVIRHPGGDGFGRDLVTSFAERLPRQFLNPDESVILVALSGSSPSKARRSVSGDGLRLHADDNDHADEGEQEAEDGSFARAVPGRADDRSDNRADREHEQERAHQQCSFV